MSWFKIIQVALINLCCTSYINTASSLLNVGVYLISYFWTYDPHIKNTNFNEMSMVWNLSFSTYAPCLMVSSVACTIKHMTIINDESSIVSKWSSKLIDDARVIIYDCYMVIIQVTDEHVYRYHRYLWSNQTGKIWKASHFHSLRANCLFYWTLL